MIIRIVKNETSADGRDMSKYSINGEGEYNKTQASVAAVTMTIKELVEKGGKSLQQAIDRINQIKIDGSFVTVSAEKGFYDEKRCKETVVETSKGKFTIYVNNQWTPKRFGNFILGMNDSFNSEVERKDREEDEKKGGLFSKIKSIFGLGDAKEEPSKTNTAESVAADTVKAEEAAAKKEAEKLKAEAEKAAADKAKKEAEAEKAKLQAEKAELDRLKAEADKAKAELAAVEKMKAELEKAKAEAEKAKADAEKAKAEAAKSADELAKLASSMPKEAPKRKPNPNDPFDELMVKVEGDGKIADFYICKFQVTQAQWKAVMGNNPSEFQGDDNPVDNVSWLDCRKFIDKLNELTGKEYRLPKREEWYYAAKGGKMSKKYTYPGSDDLYEVAWYTDNCDRKTHPVGKKKPNELGLYDMSGNVGEWCYEIDETDKKALIGYPYRYVMGGSIKSEKLYLKLDVWGQTFQESSGNKSWGCLGLRLAL